MKCVILVFFALLGNIAIGNAADFRSVKFAATIRVWNCPANFSDTRQCEFSREEISIQKLELTRNVLGFQIGDMSFTRSGPVTIFFGVYAVLAAMEDGVPDQYTFGLSAGFSADSSRNPFNETSFDSRRLPQDLTVFSGFQKFGDREVAAALDLKDIGVSWPNGLNEKIN